MNLFFKELKSHRKSLIIWSLALVLFVAMAMIKYDATSAAGSSVNALLKDNADDIKDKINNWKIHPVISEIIEECNSITSKYCNTQTLLEPKKITYADLATEVKQVFICNDKLALEDGIYNLSVYVEGNMLKRFATTSILMKQDRKTLIVDDNFLSVFPNIDARHSNLRNKYVYLLTLNIIKRCHQKKRMILPHHLKLSRISQL